MIYPATMPGITYAIWAKSGFEIMGSRGKLPWPRIQADMDFFRKMTDGAVMIMGRKTYDSLPPKFDPGNRILIVVTSMYKVRRPTTPATIMVGNVDWAHALASNMNKPIFIIGGAQIFDTMHHYVTKAFVTEIRADYPGDVTAPGFVHDRGRWQRHALAINVLDANTGIFIDIHQYRRL